MDKYLTVREVADKVGVSPTTVRRWDKSGKFLSTRHPMNNYRVYTDQQVISLMKEFSSEIKIEIDSTNHNIEKFIILQTPYGKLYQVDAVAFLRSLPDESVHLIFADPPYNIKKAEWDTFESQKKYIEWSMIWIKEAHRVLHPQGSLYVCGFSEILADIKWAAAHLFKGCKWLVWYYRNKANLGNDWGRSHESILHFRKSKNFIFHLDEARLPYNQHTLKYPKHPQAETSQYNNGNKEYIWTPHPNGAKPKDVMDIPTISNSSWEKRPHPTQKPIELTKKIILSSSNPDSLIVDPFGGSGTTYVIAEAFKRRWLGSEINKDYCKIIESRLSDKAHLERIYIGKDESEAAKRRKKIRV
jgi:site-specific DNA-methyltransferase (adenine-specific)